MKTQAQLELGITPVRKRRYRKTPPTFFTTLEAARSYFDRLAPGKYALRTLFNGYEVVKL